MQAESALVKYLLANQNNAVWIAAVDRANQSAAIQISTGQPVMALGGFNGSDTPLTLTQFKALVVVGKVRYYTTSTNGMGRGSPGGNNEIATWAKSAGTTDTAAAGQAANTTSSSNSTAPAATTSNTSTTTTN